MISPEVDDGLPDLPALAGVWRPSFSYPSTDGVAFTVAASGDVNRWLICFVDTLGSGLVVTPDPTGNVSVGFTVPVFGDKTFKAKDYGDIVGMTWYVWARAATGNIMVVTQNINKRRRFGLPQG